LCLVAFLLLTAGEAWAEEQPNQTQMVQQGTVESKTMIDGKEILDPLPTAPSPSETAPVEAYPVRTEKPPPSPAAPAQMTSVTDYLASQRPAPQQFAVTIVNGEVVGSDPVVQEPPPTPTSASGDGRPPAPQAAVPAQSGPQTTSDPEPVASSSDGGAKTAPAPRPDSSTDNALPSVSSEPTPQASDPVPWPTLEPEPVASGENVSLPVAAGEPLAPAVAGTSVSSAAHKSPAAGPTVPVGVGGTSPLPSSSGTTATSTMSDAMSNVVNSAANIVHDAAASVAVEISGILASGSVDPSSGETHDSSQEEAPQPVIPLAPPEGGSSFFSLSGGGQGGSLGVAPLLLPVGILASSLVLLRRSGWRYLASYEVPKPSSALLLPLERPG
jgi:hypothetical protein